MKKLAILPLILAACAPAPEQGRIVSEAQFRSAIVGKPIRLEEGVVFTIHGNNTISGTVDGRSATGTWAFNDGFWCRTITLDQQISEDCQLWVVEGDRLVITRERGMGESFAYRLAR